MYKIWGQESALNLAKKVTLRRKKCLFNRESTPVIFLATPTENFFFLFIKWGRAYMVIYLSFFVKSNK